MKYCVLLRLITVLAVLGVTRVAASEHDSALPDSFDYRHGYAFLAEPKYPSDFTHFDFANPSAPKGGRIRVPQMGTWDSFNPISEKGRLAAGMGFWSRDTNLLWDTLTVPALDEPATEYGLIAEGIAVAPDNSWVAFKLREAARFHDGHPITADDVAFSLTAAQDHAASDIRSSFAGFTLEILGPREVRFSVPPEWRDDPTVPVRLGGLPILPEHDWQERDIAKTTVEPPLGSGPYRIGGFRVGRWLQYERVRDYWAADLPVYRGRFNFDSVKFDYFRDDQVQTEAVKGNVVDVHVENVPSTWYESYDVPAVHQGHLRKAEFTLSRPAGLWWPIFWNMAQPRFQDLRVRKALWLLRDFEWDNKRSYGFWGHATSFFHDSELSARGLPGPLELALLEPLRGQVPGSVFTEPYVPQPNAGPGWSRANLLEANRLLNEAGWVVEDGRRVHRDTGEPFHIRLVAVSPALGGSFVSYTRLLQRLGITSSIKSPEISNWLYRKRSGDFDGGSIWFLPDFTPTRLIKNTFHGSEADKPYGSNWSNLNDPAIDSLIDAIGSVRTWPEYVAAIRAFDRVMLHNYYWIPLMSKTTEAVAYWNKFGIPEHGRLKRLAFTDLWWQEAELASKINRFTGGDK